MTDNAYTVTDLIKLSAEQKPIDFEQAFNSLMVDRVQLAVDAKKVEVAQSVFASQDEAEDEEFEAEDFEEESEELESEEDNNGETA